MSRKDQIRKRLRKETPQADVAGMHADDPRTRGRAVRTACPCRNGWDVYNANREEVLRLTKDEDPTVRFNALHVQDDAFLMELLDDKRARAEEAAERRAARVRLRGRKARPDRR